MDLDSVRFLYMLAKMVASSLFNSKLAGILIMLNTLFQKKKIVGYNVIMKGNLTKNYSFQLT